MVRKHLTIRVLQKYQNFMNHRVFRSIMNGIDGVFSDANTDNLFGVVEAFNDSALA